MGGPAQFVVLGLTDAVNPLTIGLVAEAVHVLPSRRPAIAFCAVTFVINSVAAWLVLTGLNAVLDLRHAWWLGLLVIATGGLLIADAGRQLWQVWVRQDDPIRKIPALGLDLPPVIGLAAVVNIALLPFAGQVAAAMTMLSTATTNPATQIAGVLTYNLIYTAPLWVLVLAAPVLSRVPRLPTALRPCAGPVVTMAAGITLLAIGAGT